MNTLHMMSLFSCESNGGLQGVIRVTPYFQTSAFVVPDAMKSCPHGCRKVKNIHHA